MISAALQIAKTEFSLRDQGTFLGFIWTLINPVLLFATLYGLFSKNAPQGEIDTNFAFYLMAGILFWNFFSGCSTAGVTSISNRPQYLLTTTIPFSSLVLGIIFTQGIITSIEATICFGVLIIADPLQSIKLLNFFIGILVSVPICITIALILVWIRRFFLDATRLWDLALRIGFFLTPIFYYIEDSGFHQAQRWNPLVYPLQICREGVSAVSVPSLNVIFIFTIIAGALLYYTEKKKSLIIEVL